MPIITGLTVDYAVSPRIVNIPDAWGDVTVQDLWDSLSEKESELNNLMFKKLIDRPRGGGKGVLSATKSVGISLVLNNAQVKFFDQAGPAYVIKRVIDGNLTAIDDLEAALEPLTSSTFTNWKNEADVSAAIIANSLSSADATAVANEVFQLDMDTVEAASAIHSLCSAVLKAVSRSRDNAGSLETFRTDGVTVHMSQPLTTDAALDPVDEVGTGS